MTSLFDRTLPDGRRAADVLFAQLGCSGGDLNFVDVGARNGSFLLPAEYAKRSCITGFEPNATEYEKLVTQNTDAKAAGLTEHEFKRRKYFPWALWDRKERRKLHIPVGVGAATLMGPVDSRMTSNMWHSSGAGGATSYEINHRPDRTTDVECAALEDLFPADGEIIDILKLDVEGGELAVLSGAAGLLKQHRILFIYSEFQFTPYYQDRVTLGHQQVLLDELGYRLISLDLGHAEYCWKPTKVDPKRDRWLTYGGDAVFVVDPDRVTLTADQQYRLGLACIAFGFNAFGLNLVHEAGVITPAELEALTDEINRRSFGSRLKDLWLAGPDIGYRILQNVGLR